MKTWLTAIALAAASPLAQAAGPALVVHQDPNCGCCSGWVEHMRESGFQVTAISSTDMASVKQKLGVPMPLASCHTGVLQDTGQIIEGHVPANVVRKLLADSSVKGVAAPGMPLNAPGMGALDGNLVTVDFDGKPFSRD
ncbi:DUF411 domain-containing protein [Castellaniella sp. GW247-6E4]|uniref:DUF411 domain-containing protein n=1 Tax=Castellaniella sp. GW247-6E4 TaxID=3140380 RepID=UPI003314BEAE